MNVTRIALASLLSLPLVACGAGKAGEAVRPSDPTMADARGGAPVECHEVGDEGTPLIVDWEPEARGDLEVAMKGGVAVVHYDCKAIKVLPDCHVDGKYAYVGTSKKEQLITLDNADQAQANLPLSGAKIGGGLSRGSSLDIGLIMVGKTSTTALAIDKSMLSGRCDGATHFVHSATVGAFAMKTATSGEVHAAADVFGVGASASSASNKTASNKDGDIEACNAADPDGKAAPKNCGALLRVQLLGVSAGSAKPPAQPEADKDVACAKGLVATNGKCVPPAAATSHDCLMQSRKECAEQCEKGNAASCSAAGLLFDFDVDGPADPAQSAKYDGKGCDLGEMAACTSFALDLVKGEGVGKDQQRGLSLLVKACNAGEKMGCDAAGDIFTGQSKIWAGSPVDWKNGVRAYARGCDLGNGFSCGKLGEIAESGKAGVAPNPTVARDFYAQACKGGDKKSCAKVK